MIASSRTARAVEPSLTRRLFNLAHEREDVIDLTLGDPDLVPQPVIRAAACDAVNAGRTHYSANAGIPELREAFAGCVAAEYGVEVDPETEVIVTVGGMEALYLALSAILDEGDEVILFAPYYVNYLQMVRMCGAVPVVVETDPASGFSWVPARVEAAITERTKAIVVNTPCNPTGHVASAGEVDAVAAIARGHDLVVLTDEVYRTLVYDGRTHESILTRPGMRERTILVDSVSKRFSMTGYRVGFAVGPAPVVADMTKMQENVAACAPLPSQHAALAAYTECLADTWLQETFEIRRNRFCGQLAELTLIEAQAPEGAFYVFADVSATGMGGEEFAYALLDAEGVAVVPGIAYGEAYTHHVRIALTHNVGVLDEAIKRIGRFLASVGGGR